MSERYSSELQADSDKRGRDQDQMRPETGEQTRLKTPAEPAEPFPDEVMYPNDTEDSGEDWVEPDDDGLTYEREPAEPYPDEVMYPTDTENEVDDPWVLKAEDEFIDWHNANVKLRLRRTSRIAYHDTQRLVHIPIGLLQYPLTTLAKSNNSEPTYAVYGDGEEGPVKLFSRQVDAPIGKSDKPPHIQGSTLIYYLTYAFQSRDDGTSRIVRTKNGLICPSIRSIHNDLFGKTNYYHNKFKLKMMKELDALSWTSYYWGRFQVGKEERRLRLRQIIDRYQFVKSETGRKQTSLEIIFNDLFLPLISLEATVNSTCRVLSLDEILQCKTPYSRRMYELIMMEMPRIGEGGWETNFNEFRDLLGAKESIRGRKSMVMKSVQKAMDDYVSPITGVVMDWAGSKLVFRCLDKKRLMRLEMA